MSVKLKSVLWGEQLLGLVYSMLFNNKLEVLGILSRIHKQNFVFFSYPLILDFLQMRAWKKGL